MGIFRKLRLPDYALKGIQTTEDPHTVMDAHMDGTIVSNYGVRSWGPNESPRKGASPPIAGYCS